MKKKILDCYGERIEIQVDKEDKYLFDSYRAIPKYEYSREAPSYIIFTNYEGSDPIYASRVIMNNHGLLKDHQNVKFKDGDPWNLQKKNLYAGKRAKGKS